MDLSENYAQLRNKISEMENGSDENHTAYIEEKQNDRKHTTLNVITHEIQ